MSELDNLAKEVNNKYAINKYLHKKYHIYNDINSLTKEIMTKCLLEKKNPLLPIFTRYSKEIQKNRKNIYNDYVNLFEKFNLLLDECRSDLTMGKPILSQKKNEEFALEYEISEKNDIINSLKKSIKLSKEYRLFREPKREKFVDEKKGNKEAENVKNELHQNMLYELKNSNKFINKIKNYELKILVISKNIDLLNNYIESKNFKVSTFEDSSKQNKKKKKRAKYQSTLMVDGGTIQPKNYKDDILENNSDDDRINKNSSKLKNKVIQDFIKFEDFLDISIEEGESEEIIDDELHSDDESNFENRIKPLKKLSVNYLKDIKNIIPSLNLNQIKFNIKKKEDDIDSYSLDGKRYLNKNVFNQVKDMKKKIEKINIKLGLLKQKENKISEFVKKIEKNYKSIRPTIYQNSEANIKIDYILNSLNGEFKKGKKKNYDNPFDNIKEEEEIYYNENEENEKSDDKKETKDTKKEDEEKRKKIKNIIKSVLPKKEPDYRGIANNKKHRKKILISINANAFQNKINEIDERPKSK